MNKASLQEEAEPQKASAAATGARRWGKLLRSSIDPLRAGKTYIVAGVARMGK